MDVTVVVPAYNAAATIAETLDSILAQDRVPKEIIVIDDGSTDETGDVARGFPGVVVFRQANGGHPAAMNAGMELTRTEAVALLDADDLFAPGRLTRQTEILRRSPELAATIGEVEEFVCPSLDAATASRLIPRPRQPGWLSGSALLRMSAVRTVGLLEASLKVGAWVDWVHRARAMGFPFEVDTELVLRRRIRPGTLNASPQRDEHFLQVARRALLRRRGQTE